MANDKITMLKLKRMLQLLAANQSMNSICSELHMSKRTVQRYKTAALSTGKSYLELFRFSEDELSTLLQPSSALRVVDVRKAYLDTKFDEYLSELRRPYTTVQNIWESYIVEKPEGYQYTQFKKYLLTYKKSREYSYHNTYAPGHEWQVDFAGDKLYLTDRRTHVKTPVVMLCCILPYSGLSFAMAMLNATMEHLFHGLSKGLEYLGGVPSMVKTDNMAQWIKKTSRYEPVFTQATEQWCLHYNITPDAARVRRPRDKGPVEGLVNKLYQFVYARIRDEVFYDLGALNSRILELVDEFNSRNIQKKGISRLDIFIREEKAMLRELPEEPFGFRYRKEFTISASYHVSVGSEKHSYSIPFKYVSQKASVLWDMETVEVYVSNKRVAIHKRAWSKHGYTTQEEHMPPNHLAYKRSKEYNAAAIRVRAMLIGENTTRAVDMILSRRIFPQHSYKSCQGVFSLAAKYGEKRVEAACIHILSQTSAITYVMIRNVLEKNLDRAVGQGSEMTTSITPSNQHVRGAKEYEI